MASFVCDHCKRGFEGEEARCPKCLRKSSVREETPLTEPEALASSTDEPSVRPGLYLGLVGLSFVLSLTLLAMFLSFDRTLAVIRGEVPAAIGLLLGSLVSLGLAPRFSLDEDRPMLAYAKWLGIAALVGTSVMIAGIAATWMLADDSVVLAAVVAVVLWLGAAIPAFNFALRTRVARESRRAAPPAGKWR